MPEVTPSPSPPTMRSSRSWVVVLMLLPYALVFLTPLNRNQDAGVLFLVPPIIALIWTAARLVHRGPILTPLLTFCATALFAFAITVPNWLHADVRRHTLDAWNDQRMLALALNAYHGRKGRYPGTLDAAGPPIPDAYRNGEPYGYWSDGERWLLSSWGPDWEATLPADWPASASGEPGERWQELLVPFQYDPTNGIKSRGDIIKTGP